MRKWTETIKSWPQLSARRLYRMRVLDVRKATGDKGMEVVFEFQDEQQMGRKFDDILTLPIRPAGRTAEFFLASGQNITTDGSIAPRDAIGCEMGVRFKKSPDNDKWQAIHFEPLGQEPV